MGDERRATFLDEMIAAILRHLRRLGACAPLETWTGAGDHGRGAALHVKYGDQDHLRFETANTFGRSADKPASVRQTRGTKR